MYLQQVPTDNVRTSGKKPRFTNKKLSGDDKVIEAVTTPKPGRNRAKTIAQ